MGDDRLTGANRVQWRLKGAPSCFQPDAVIIGNDPMGLALEVAVAEWACPGEPSRDVIRKAHKDRQAKRVSPLVVMLVHGDRTLLLGPTTDADFVELPTDQATRVLQAALDEPDGLAARTRLDSLTASATSTHHSGVSNEGLFAGHYLATSAPERADWAESVERAQPLLGLRHETLVRELGYSTKHTAGHALLLSAATDPRAVAVLLEADEQFDAATSRFHLSPVAYGLQIAAREAVPWLIVMRGSQIRLYPARPGVGVGQKGQADTWFELDLAVVDAQRAGLLPLVFSADALAPDGSTQQLLDGSNQFAVELGERLRDRVYDQAIPVLAKAVAGELGSIGQATDAAGLELAYRLSVKILFRLLFQAYAEDSGLLPYGRNKRYGRNALKTWAADLSDDPDQPFDPNSTAIWDDLVQVWRVIDSGDAAWDVPAYNGGLFGSDPDLHPEGASLAQLKLGNDAMGPVLRALLVDDLGPDAIGPVDFRSLSVREFGTIYEGLLESSLSLAPADLTIDRKGTYVPATAGRDVLVAAGEVYFHSASGQRKSTGTYFTPHIVVEHLLQRALVPRLTEHLERVGELLEDGDEAAAAEMFFDFRVADLAMGSGHFLTAAIDHIESGMRDFLTEHPIPAITDELRRLEQAATEALGEDANAAEIEPASLLRRQVARRCIYGLDLNPMAVELARLAIWITTFVPGLPMSSLDHTLVCANSLTGVGTIDEALTALDPGHTGGQVSLFADAIHDELAEARDLLIAAANTSEATKAEVTLAAEAAQEARQAAEPARLIFDAVVAARLKLLDPAAYFDPKSLQVAAAQPDVATDVALVQPAHFPFLFPEVFLRDNPGFDVLLGNPPWDEVMVEEPKFWLRYEPGLLGLKPAHLKNRIAELRRERSDLLPELEREIREASAMRAVLLAGNYPGLGTGDIDLYRVFAWQNWHLARCGAHLGLVFPRSLLNSAGNAEWRQTILNESQLDVVTLLNTGKWVFSDVDGRYSFALAHITKVQADEASVSISGPFASAQEFLLGKDDVGHIQVSLLNAGSFGAALPQLPGTESAGVFAQIRKAPRLDERSEEWDFRPVREFDATNDRKTFDAGAEGLGRWPVYGGTAFNIWQPDTGEYYAWADPETVTAALGRKRKRQANNKRSAFFGASATQIADLATLPCHEARIAFRDVVRATDTRTMIAALVPPSRVLTNKAPYLLKRAGTSRSEAFLVGVLSSIPLDWYTRRYVEIGMSIGLFNSLPIPPYQVGDRRCTRTVEIAALLSATDERFRPWAVAVGVPVGSITTPVERDDLIAELDALVGLLYGLSRSQLEHVFATFHRGWDYRPRLDAVLVHFDSWQERVS